MVPKTPLSRWGEYRALVNTPADSEGGGGCFAEAYVRVDVGVPVFDEAPGFSCYASVLKIKLRKHDCKKGLWCKILSEMATLLHVLYLLALLLSSAYVQTQKHPLYVYTDGGNGRDSRECLTHNSIREPCRTLTYVADNLESASVDIYVLSDWLNLTDAVEFKDFQPPSDIWE